LIINSKNNMASTLVFAGLVSTGLTYLPPQSPHWTPTYDMGMSTITMQCNGSGLSSPERGSQFGIVSYDWSNMKKQWAADKPMDSEMRLYEQAKLTKAKNPKSHVFVYRNVVKALPWMKTVREKLDDPAYSSWFLKFSGKGNYSVPQCAPENSSHCSDYYHDQEQTPEVPGSGISPDGDCVGYCDCGVQPCGEYLFDHRNGSMLRDWIVNELIAGPTGTGAPEIDGLFIDDYWCSDMLCKEHPGTASCPCGDPVQGPTEINKYNQVDMGLSDDDVKEITMAWNVTMAAVQQKMLDTKAYTWSLIQGQENANAAPLKLDQQGCYSALTDATKADSDWQMFPQIFGFTVNGTTLPQFKQDLAYFLIARGDYAWAGWGVWGMTWPFNAEPAHGGLPPSPGGVPRPSELELDYGTPKGLSVEDKTTKGLFTREYTKASVALNCNTFEAKITMHADHN